MYRVFGFELICLSLLVFHISLLSPYVRLSVFRHVSLTKSDFL